VNFSPKNPPKSALPEVVDTLLADIAIRIQLTKTDHDKAVDRFEVMRDWIDRPGSPPRRARLALLRQNDPAHPVRLRHLRRRHAHRPDAGRAHRRAREADQRDLRQISPGLPYPNTTELAGFMKVNHTPAEAAEEIV
jgi:hypothetical protein